MSKPEKKITRQIYPLVETVTPSRRLDHRQFVSEKTIAVMDNSVMLLNRVAGIFETRAQTERMLGCLDRFREYCQGKEANRHEILQKCLSGFESSRQNQQGSPQEWFQLVQTTIQVNRDESMREYEIFHDILRRS